MTITTTAPTVHAEPDVPAWFNLEALPEDLRAQRAEIIGIARGVAELIRDARVTLTIAHRRFTELDQLVEEALGDGSDDSMPAKQVADRVLGLDVLYSILAHVPTALDMLDAGEPSEETEDENAATMRALLEGAGPDGAVADDEVRHRAAELAERMGRHEEEVSALADGDGDGDIDEARRLAKESRQIYRELLDLLTGGER